MTARALTFETLRLDRRVVKVQIYPDVTDWNHLFQWNGKRFVWLFRQAWKGLPPSARTTLWGHWRTTPDAAFYPTVVVRAGVPPDLLRSSDGLIARATTGDMGRSMHFSAFSFSILNDREFVETVVHELAHCYRWAMRQHSNGYALEENETNNLAKRWLNKSGAKDR